MTTRYKVIPVLLFFILVGCGSRLDVTEEGINTSYFDLKTLLDEELEQLVLNGASLEKRLTSDGKEDRLTISLDSAGWHEQFKLFYEADINKPGFVGEYFEEELPAFNGVSKVIYSTKNQKNPVQVMECFYADGVLQEVRLIVKEINSVYAVTKNLSLYFEASRLASFDIKGEESMRLKKDLNYQIQGTIVRSL